VEGKTIRKLNEILAKGKFRNKSHVIEEAIELLREKVDEG
jgi:Arc/MetJ-type ribon-helix-helix transcriptional regulator